MSLVDADSGAEGNAAASFIAGAQQLLDSGTPYAHYPTSTRFLRADYKFYKTLEDTAEFEQRIAQLPLPQPRPPPTPHHSQRQRPATAHPAAGFPASRRPINKPHRQHIATSQWREPEPGWRPIYPEPDLSTQTTLTPPTLSDLAPAPPVAEEYDVKEASAASSDRRPSQQLRRRPLTAPPQQQHSQQQQHQQPQRPKNPSPLVLVDFSENSQPQPPQPLQGGKSCPAAATRFFRPKTAPSKVATADFEAAAAASVSGLQIHGRSLRPVSSGVEKHGGGVEAVGPSKVRQLSDAYDKALGVHGWKLEVPGDPFGIKRQFIAERKPISVVVPEPLVKPPPPRMMRTNRFTFFHTTAPRVVMSFDIHPNFTSERYTKAKAALIKQGKWDYSYRDYAFMY